MPALLVCGGPTYKRANNGMKNKKTYLPDTPTTTHTEGMESGRVQNKPQRWSQHQQDESRKYHLESHGNAVDAKGHAVRKASSKQETAMARARTSSHFRPLALTRGLGGTASEGRRRSAARTICSRAAQCPCRTRDQSRAGRKRSRRASLAPHRTSLGGGGSAGRAWGGGGTHVMLVSKIVSEENGF